MSLLPIRPYELRPAAFHPWDPRTAEVARDVARLVASAWPGVVVEHVGSSAVPGLPGKNIVDLGMEASPDDIPAVTDTLLSLGFGRQTGIAPFPPTRPMLTGCVDVDGTPYRIHLHVMPPARRELPELVAFRDALRVDPVLRDAYADAKERLVADAAAGRKPIELYTVNKSDFVVNAIHRLGIRRGPADAVEPLQPGSTIGVLGGGQLGRMLGFAARAMGYRLIALDPDPFCPTAAVADEIIVGRYDDVEAARRLAARSDVVTYELEHVGLEAAAAAAELAPLRPGLAALRATQDRLAERRFIREIGEWTAPWRETASIEEALEAGDALGYPFRLKLPLGGYDGRSQARVVSPDGVAAAVASLGGEGRPLLAESEIPFAAELSVVSARGRDGRSLAFPIARNVHDAGILAESVAPAPVHPAVAYDASEIADSIARGLDMVGLVTAELFQLEGGGLMINELAPRVHNSGHWTIEGAMTSQFEQHLRAILGLPLGSVAPHGAAAMVNLLGTGPDRDARLIGLDLALGDPAAKVHVYGKRRVFERRKMGHVTVVGWDVDDALERARRARAALRWED
ncbi:MAG: 5-(carboxyamino)imidazole ribonucleotide synthase [Chloroflexota bacterium]